MTHILYLDSCTECIAAFLDQAKLKGFTAVAASSAGDGLIRLQQKTPQAICIGKQFPPTDLAEFESRLPEAKPPFFFLEKHASNTKTNSQRPEAAINALLTDIEHQTGAAEPSGNDFEAFTGSSAAMQTLYKQIAKIAPTDIPVLLTGETGTGKELAARALHRLSKRHNGNFLAINCSAIAPQLIDSELFGHERGSFTGAESLRQGYFECTSEGTLFLDEITEMPIAAQSRLLRVLESGEYIKVGSNRVGHSTARIIAATNRPPKQAVAEERLRADLYFRLSVFPIYLPALREHSEDIPQIACAYLRTLNERYDSHKFLNQASLQTLQQYPWPGNVRELQHAILRSFILSEQAELFPERYTDPLQASGKPGP